MAIQGTIFDIKKYALHDGPGIRTTVFFRGCPLTCPWCHNPESRMTEMPLVDTCGRPPIVDRSVTVDELMAEISKDEIFYDQSGGGVTFSGGEPMLQIEFLASVLMECQRLGIHTAIDTSGCIPVDNFAKIVEVVDLWLYDLKLADSAAHEKYTGHPNDLVIANLRRLDSQGCRIWLRLPMIPGITDTTDNITAIIDVIGSLKNLPSICLLPYNRMGEDKYRRWDIEPPAGHLFTQTADEMEARAELFRAAGMKVRIGG